jgi:hypothetical protein
MIESRICITCGVRKEESCFSLRGGRNKESKYLKSECKTCCTARASAWRTGNRERYNEYQREYNDKAPKTFQVESKGKGLTATTHEQGEGK